MEIEHIVWCDQKNCFKATAAVFTLISSKSIRALFAWILHKFLIQKSKTKCWNTFNKKNYVPDRSTLFAALVYKKLIMKEKPEPFLI